VPAVPEVVLTSLPWAHRFRVHVVPAESLATVKVAWLGVIIGPDWPADAGVPLAKATTRDAPMHNHSRFILRLLVPMSTRFVSIWQQLRGRNPLV